MTIASEIQRIQDNIANAYNACAYKNATMPATNNSANLESTINSITAGGGGSGLNFDNVTAMTTGVSFHDPNITGELSLPQATLMSGTGGGQINVSGSGISSFSAPNISSITNGLIRLYKCKNLTSVDIHNLSSISQNVSNMGTFNSFLNDCPNIQSVNFPNLLNAPMNSFEGAFQNSGIVSTDFSNLSSVGANAFRGAFANTNNYVFANFQKVSSVTTNGFSGAFHSASGLLSADFSNVISAGYQAFYYAFNSSGLVSADFSNVTNLTGNSAFRSSFTNTPLESFEMNYVTSASQNSFANCFDRCSNLTYFSMSGLEDCGFAALSYVCNGCQALTHFDLSNLKVLSGASAFFGAFRNCKSLTTCSFPSLTTINGNGDFVNCWRDASNISSIYFNSLTTVTSTQTNAFMSALAGVDGCTVHFNSSVQATIGTWANVTSGMGGTNTTILFDL